MGGDRRRQQGGRGAPSLKGRHPRRPRRGAIDGGGGDAPIAAAAGGRVRRGARALGLAVRLALLAALRVVLVAGRLPVEDVLLPDVHVLAAAVLVHDEVAALLAALVHQLRILVLVHHVVHRALLAHRVLQRALAAALARRAQLLHRGGEAGLALVGRAPGALHSVRLSLPSPRGSLLERAKGEEEGENLLLLLVCGGSRPAGARRCVLRRGGRRALAVCFFIFETRLNPRARPRPPNGEPRAGARRR